MKIDFLSLLESLKEMKYDYSRVGGEDVEKAVLTVEIVEENPGEGVMVGCLRLSSVSQAKTLYTGKAIEVTRTIEVYSAESTWVPRFSRQEVSEVSTKS